jgi:hypothetical protein
MAICLAKSGGRLLLPSHLAAFGILVWLVSMGAIDDMRGNMLVDEGRNKSNDNHASQEESD